MPVRGILKSALHCCGGRPVASARWGGEAGPGVVADDFEKPELIVVAESWRDNV